MRHIITIALLAALALAGCGKKDEGANKAPPPAPKPTQPVDPAPTPVPPEPDPADQVATEQDFEEEATQGITADNLEAEVGKIEGEIGE
jgi:PBP1b-binding outer membrane lipoprotein LpoB